jgi:flagellar hook-basal body complex protein FliE
MTVLPIGAIGGEFSISHLGKLGSAEASTGAGGLGGASQAQGASGLGALEGSTGVEGTGGVEGASGVEGAAGAGSSTGAEGGFSSALTNAISSLDQSQQSASAAAQGLATGSISDPESAVVTVEEAQLAMQLASQIRTKATEAAQQIFQTQV